jgi:hypothetical protein
MDGHVAAARGTPKEAGSVAAAAALTAADIVAALKAQGNTAYGARRFMGEY